jgi:hypothetical protein
VRRLLACLLPLVGPVPVSAHFHDTRGTGMANVLAGLDHGVRRFDASLGGIGGCPNAPGATGNIATEDLAYMLEAMGYHTGIDLRQVIELRRQVQSRLPGVAMHGHLMQAGLPAGFAYIDGSGPRKLQARPAGAGNRAALGGPGVFAGQAPEPVPAAWQLPVPAGQSGEG